MTPFTHPLNLTHDSKYRNNRWAHINVKVLRSCMGVHVKNITSGPFVHTIESDSQGI